MIYLFRKLRILYHLQKNRIFWKKYYSKHRMPVTQSPFAEFSLSNYIKKDNWVLELGCGNGRDAVFFASKGINVLGLDLCRQEISYLKKYYKNKKLSAASNKLRFKCTDFTRFKSRHRYDVVYSRFTLHSISEEQEQCTIKNSYRNLKDGGLLLIEARSIKDEMYSISEKISMHEGITDHYRRFINLDVISKNIEENKFKIIFSVEAQDLAKYKDENPYVIRIVAKKIVEAT